MTQAVVTSHDELRQMHVSLILRVSIVINVNLNEQVLSTIEHLRPEIADDNIFFSLILFTDLWMIRVDPGEIRKILATLLVGSCKSLPGGGRITIETANLPVSNADCLDGRPELIPGDYVMLSLSDTDSSRSTAVNRRLARPLQKVWHPTSKSASAPASTDDFVRKSGGNIVRYNRPGPGTTVSLFFPRCRMQAAINSNLPLQNSSALR